MNPIVLEAMRQAEVGQVPVAIDRLERAIAAGEPDAAYLLGLWLIEGKRVERDLKRAHALVAAAAAKDHMAAARTLSALLVVGVGGAADWAAALALLRVWRERDPLAARQLQTLDAPHPAPGEPDVLSYDPYVAVIPGLFDARECQLLIALGEPRMKPAQAFDERQGRFVPHPDRVGEHAGFPVIFEWPAVHAFNARIAEATRTSTRQGEPLQLLRYGAGQQYRPHLDAVPGLENQRIMTALVALSDDYEGGQTAFPKLGIEWRGAVGDALIFANVDAAGRPDQRTVHAGLPVTRSIKLLASRWIRAQPAAPGESFGHHEVLSAG